MHVIDQNLQCSGLKCILLITTKFCTRHDSVTVVTCAKFLCDWLCISLANRLFIQQLAQLSHKIKTPKHRITGHLWGLNQHQTISTHFYTGHQKYAADHRCRIVSALGAIGRFLLLWHIFVYSVKYSVLHFDGKWESFIVMRLCRHWYTTIPFRKISAIYKCTGLVNNCPGAG